MGAAMTAMDVKMITKRSNISNNDNIDRDQRKSTNNKNKKNDRILKVSPLVATRQGSVGRASTDAWSR